MNVSRTLDSGISLGLVQVNDKMHYESDVRIGTRSLTKMNFN